MVPTLEQIEELHRRIAPSEEAYNLIHTHCVIVARIARMLAHRQNMLFTRRCTLPKDAAELTAPSAAGAEAVLAGIEAGEGAAVAGASGAHNLLAVPPSDGVTGGHVPPRLIDEHLVTIGGLLHDIGTYKVLKHDGTDGEPLKFAGKKYIKHGLLGYEYLMENGVDESIAQFARNHTGVGLTRDDVIRQELPLPPADYVPVNLEQETVMVADKYNSKSLPAKFVTAESYTKRAERFGEENKRRWLELLDQYGVVDVRPLAKEYGMVIV
ncbi:HD domain-containing protein [Bifidobacterium platyrrhinorum]|uniref:HD domain-containing protein n=1 Tax=Bifidobacterium platyrrhinorum TaxID=2661628 RepID=A0A6L9ST47_9BIFI|nr:HD domain-containing protein [Bifidobacterium platyrrhinorum]NEG55249.1 HD domain-containing protein [Bifidobacterium platyrrhinorum]